MTALRVVVVDDEPVARRGLRRHLSAHPDVAIVAECGDGRAAVAAIDELAPDLVLLDVQMPELDGFDVVEAIGADRMPAVIFVTAHDDYAIRAFEVHALDYLLKPFTGRRFAAALARARTEPAGHAVAPKLSAIVHDRGARAERLVIRDGGSVVVVPTPDITHIAAADNYVTVHVGARARAILWRETLARVAAQLAPVGFVRIHRSLVVNAQRVCELRPTSGGDALVALDDGTLVTCSRRFRHQLAAALVR